MDKWEYCLVHHVRSEKAQQWTRITFPSGVKKESDDAADLASILTHLGNDDWQAVNMTGDLEMLEDDIVGYFVVLMKRPRRSGSDITTQEALTYLEGLSPEVIDELKEKYPGFLE